MARWKPAPVIGGAYSDDAKAWTCQDTVNYIPVMAERPGGRSPTMLRGVPGMRTFCITGSNKPIRGARNVEGLLLVVTGTTLYKVSTKGAATAIGTIPGVGRVSMSHNQIAGGNEVAIANGQSGYVYNTVTGTLAQITDQGFPGAISFDFIDGYITGIEPARRFAFHSNLAAATDYNTLDRYEAEGSPDKLVGQIVDHREWWLFSERTIEPFVNTGAATNTFQRASNTMIEVGCASGASIAQMDSSVFWVGNDGIVYRANGYTPQRISTQAIEQALARCNLAQCFAFTFEDRGHKIYYLTCPDGQTWGYDAATGEWHRRQSEGLTRWRINTLTKWNGVWIAGDYTNGKLYELNWDVQDEDHAVLERRRITGVLSDNQNRVTVDGVALVLDTGTAASPRLFLPPLKLAGDMPNLRYGDSGTFQYSESGGVLPYGAFGIAAGALPPWASMNASGLVTYNVNATGTWSWTVSGQDANNTIATLADTTTVPSEILATWASRYNGATQNLTSAAVANGIIFIGGPNGDCSYSLNGGATFTIVDNKMGGIAPFNCIKFNGAWYNFGDTRAASSAPGDTFVFAAMGNPPNSTPMTAVVMTSAAYPTGALYAGRYSNHTLNSALLRMGTPGAAWTVIDTGFAYGDVKAICQAGSTYFVVCASGKILKSTDLATFALAYDTLDANLLQCAYLAYANVLVVTNNTGGVYRSPDLGSTWTYNSSAGVKYVTATRQEFLGGFIYNVQKSTDGITWTQVFTNTVNGQHSTNFATDGTLAAIGTTFGYVDVGTP